MYFNLLNTEVKLSFSLLKWSIIDISCDTNTLSDRLTGSTITFYFYSVISGNCCFYFVYANYGTFNCSCSLGASLATS